MLFKMMNDVGSQPQKNRAFFEADIKNISQLHQNFGMPKLTFDGFRKTVADEFNEVYIVDLGGDVRASPRLSGTRHNVFGIQTGGSRCFPLHIYSEDGTPHDNITDWALNKFRKQYGAATPPPQPSPAGEGSLKAPPPSGGRLGGGCLPITKTDIFHYVYAVLHNPAYREKYALNLKRDFPRIPFYADFWRWAAWGKELMELHIGYETCT
jgi:hypothetical protein